MERFEESALCREIEAFRLPRYADLPDFRLYIDQLIALVEKTLAPLMGADGEKWITATMIGNYARQGVIPRPEGKRYGREHAAYLIFVCLTKQVIAIGDIQQLIQVQRGTAFDVAVAYDYFCTELESILAHVFNGAPLRPDSSRTHARETRLVRSAGFAVAHKIYLSQYLRYLNAQAGEASTQKTPCEEKASPCGASFLRLLSKP